MIFRTIQNFKIEKSGYDIFINNMDVAAYHWGSEKTIAKFLEEIETLSFEKEKFEKNLLKHCLSVMYNERVEDVKFYRIADENKVILLASTKVKKFKDFPLFSREISMKLKKTNFSFSIIELPEEDVRKIKEENVQLPENWQFDEKLTEKFNMFKSFI